MPVNQCACKTSRSSRPSSFACRLPSSCASPPSSTDSSRQKAAAGGVYLNKAAFVDPPAFTVGNVARSEVLGLRVQHTSDLDLSLRREFKIREQWRFSLQGDAFNLLNAVYFGAPGNNIDSASFGTVTAQSNQPRKLQVSARITF